MTQCWGEAWNAGAQTWFPQNTGLPAGLSNVDSLVSFFPLLLSCSHVEGLVSHTHLAVVLQAHAPEAGGPTRVSNSVHSAQAVVLTQARRSGILVLTHSLAKCSRVDVLRGQRFLLDGACGLPPWELDSGPHISRLVAEPQDPFFSLWGGGGFAVHNSPFCSKPALCRGNLNP